MDLSSVTKLKVNFEIVPFLLIFYYVLLQVAELRNALQIRNLETKGTKSILIQRLKDALEVEENKEVSGGKMDMEISDTEDQNDDKA